MIWQHGGDIWDETKAPTGKAEGVVNSPEAVEGARALPLAPAVHAARREDRHHGHLQEDELFREGKVAYMIQWIGFAEIRHQPVDLQGRRQGRLRHGGRPEEAGRQAGPLGYNIGGQPFVLTTWNDEEVTKEAIDFVKWWLSKDTQKAFAAAGGQSGLQVGDQRSGIQHLPAVEPRLRRRASIGRRDIWHIPEFFELLVQQQEEFDKAITGQQDAKTTLDNIAKFQEETLTEAGHIQ